MLIVFGMCLNAVPLFNSCTIFQSRSILFVYNRLVVCLMSSVARGSPLVFFFFVLVAVLYCIALVSRYSILHVMFLLDLFVRSLFMVPLFMLCLYAPNCNATRDLFFNLIVDSVDPSVPTVLCGDFNKVFDHSLDHFGSATDDTSRESTPALLHLIDSCCVVDIWRYLYPASSFTWTRSNGSFAFHIDLVGCPYLWVSSVSSCDVLPCPLSDHYAVLFCFVLLSPRLLLLVWDFGNLMCLS